MILKVDDIEFNLLLNESDLNRDKTPIVFLHGFTGDSSDWQFLFSKLPDNLLPVAIDLVGHGKSGSPFDSKFYTCTAIVHQLNSIFSQLNFQNIILTGYSMGGRVALSYCLKHTQQIKAAIFESANPGIEDICLKKERVEFDFLLAEKIKNEGVESFISFWFETPLFQSLKKLPNFEKIKKKRLENNSTGLANSLLNFSTGLMMSYWDRLNSLNFPVLLISGELDKKYTKINKAMKSKFPAAEHKAILDCGHNVHIEKPEVFTKLVLDFLDTIERKK
ncbi:MAG: 2-succinyl-6-hydroxy-2,4-cyclohexadiene-1-carboxylate synthase [Ignavibacteriales bacterium]|nr:2-succinyl-6-hydroxy-2,4-cyclohexadiene-1-carboxylate synthase [Ignavibacteriales bacterium]